jgi:hypothetical protein
MDTAAQHASEGAGTAPHDVLVRLGGGVTDTMLFASVEGEARLIGAALTQAHGADRGIAEGLAHLAARTGFPLASWMGAVAGVLLDTGPLSLLLIGERPESDADALSSVRGLGVVRYYSIPSIPPPHAEREPSWPETAIAAWRRGKIDAVLVAVPDGPLPLLVLASDPGIADLAPGTARVFGRGPSLPEHLAAALAAVQCGRLLPACAQPPPGIFRRQALVTALIAAQRATGGAIWYLDIADGTTLIGASGTRADVTYERRYDCGAGAPALIANVPSADFARWLPAGIEPAAARRWALQRAAWPAAILTDPADRALACALARTLMAHVSDLGALAGADTVVLGPGWCRWATPPEMLEVVRDMIAPPKPVQIALDPDDVLAMVGMLARIRPESAETVFVHDALRPIGTLLALPHGAQRNAHPLHIALIANGSVVRREIAGETVLHLPVDNPATLEVTRGHTAVSYAVPPSECGIIVDTRRRPLAGEHAPAPHGSVSDRLRVGA